MFTNYFPAPHIPTETEHIWTQGFKRPFELYSDSLAATYYPPAQCKLNSQVLFIEFDSSVENASYYLDYNGQSAAWATEQQAALNAADIQSSSGTGQPIKLNELGQSSSLLATTKPDGLQPQPTVEESQNCYYSLSNSFFPPTEQQFSQLEVMPPNSNFTFLSEVTQTLLGNHCQ